MINICHIISGDLWAGAEAMLCQLLKPLREYKELRILVILLNEGRLAWELRNLKIDVEVIDEANNSFLAILLFVRKLFRRFKPQIIHSHGYKENLIAYLSTNLGTVSKLVETQHGLPEVDRRLTCMKHKFILWYNFRLLQCHFHAVVAVSKDIESILLGKLGFREHAVFFIHNGIKLLDAIKEKKGGGAIRIESCGRLYPVKDYLLLVKIVRECMNRNLKACFGLAGDGPELPKIKALAENYGLGAKFRLRGYLDNMGVFYQGLDIFINTSIHEGNPMSVLEAMAHQVPVIAPRVGAPRNYK